MRGQAAKAMRQAGPLAGKLPMAQQAVPLARQGADSATAWATPMVDAVRSWAAPQLEQSAHAINETIAPAISNALLTAAHKIEVPQKKGRGGQVIAGSMLVTAAAGVAAMLARRNRQTSPDAFAVATSADGERLADEETIIEYRIDGEPPDEGEPGSNIV